MMEGQWQVRNLEELKIIFILVGNVLIYMIGLIYLTRRRLCLIVKHY